SRRARIRRRRAAAPRAGRPRRCAPRGRRGRTGTRGDLSACAHGGMALRAGQGREPPARPASAYEATAARARGGSWVGLEDYPSSSRRAFASTRSLGQHREPMATLREVEINPLDVILFRGTDPVSHAICFVEAKVFGRGDFSHAGVAVTREALDLP